MKHFYLLAAVMALGLIGCDSSGTGSQSVLEKSWNGTYRGDALRIQHDGPSADTQEVDAIFFVRFDGERLDSLALEYGEGGLRPEEVVEATPDTLVSLPVETSLISATVTSDLRVGRDGEQVRGRMRHVYRNDDDERWPDSTVVEFSGQ